MNKRLTKFVVIRFNKTPKNKKPAKSSGSSSAKVNVLKALQEIRNILI